MLLFAHSMIAGVTHQQHWLLSEKEATDMSEAAAKVARHFNLGATQKGIDIMACAGVWGMAYVPRILQSLGDKPKKEQPPAPQPIPAHQTFSAG